MSHDDFQTEPVNGLPERPPEGERILWQGSPSWRALAWRAFGVRLVVLYFGAMAAWRAVDMGLAGESLTATATSVGLLCAVGGVAVAVMAAMAWLASWATVYTITNKRVAMRIGVALTVTLNLPFRWIGSAELGRHGDGTGDIPLHLTGESQIAYLTLWPHVRPWRMAKPEPSLRCIRDADKVAGILAGALKEAHGIEPPRPAPARASRAGAGQAGMIPAE